MSDVRETQLIRFEEAAALLNVPASTLSRWVRQGKINCRRQVGGVVFSVAELQSWALEHDIHLVQPQKKFREETASPYGDLVSALKRGGVHRVKSESQRSLFQQIVATLEDLSSEMQSKLVEALMERESMAPTSMGRGFAFPHPRLPERFSFRSSIVGVFYLDSPLAFSDTDDETVSIVFPLFTPDTREHLRLMALLSRLLRKKEALAFFRQKPDLQEILNRLDSDVK